MSDITQISQSDLDAPKGTFPTPNPKQGKNKKRIIILATSAVLAAGAVAAAIFFIPSEKTGKAVISGHDSEDEEVATEVSEVEESVEAVEVVEAEPETAYSAAYWLVGSFTDEYGVERPLCFELEAYSIDDSPRGKIHNLNANAAVFVKRSKTDKEWIYRGQDKGRQYTLIIPRGSASGDGAVIDINGFRAEVSFNGKDYYSAHSAANAATNQAKDINNINSIDKVKDDYYLY